MTELNNEAYEKVEDARFILENLGMDAERSNERSALVFLSLLGIAPDSPWVTASNPMLGTRAIMDFIRDKYGKNYAPNTREIIRRFTLHQFIEALLVAQNPDKPDRPVNSPNWNYQITDKTLKLIQHYGQEDWNILLDDYLKSIPGLKYKYAAQREMEKIPLILPDGKNFALTPGGQNILIKSIVEEFCPHFTPGGQIIYIGDAGSKWALFEEKALSSLHVTVDEHGKMPDMIIYLRNKNWLVLIEAASSHGPVDSTRKNELSELFSSSTAGIVYVSCFPSRAVFRKYVDKIAWETDIWCADNPTHMIHYNGERFLGPYN